MKEQLQLLKSCFVAYLPKKSKLAMQTRKEANFFLHADKPITTKVEDILSRHPFAQSVGDAIQGWSGNESLVIGIYGEWGSGKSSFINLLIEYLETKKDKPLIVSFNPWEWSAQDKLSEAFFREVEKALGHPNNKKKYDKQERYWKALSARLEIFSIPAPAPGVIQLIIGALLIVASIPGFNVIKSWINMDVIPPWLPIAAIACLSFIIFTFFVTRVRAIANYIASMRDFNDISTSDLKNKISKLLKALDQPILMIIDDIDRLSSDEIKTIFQLIKANADFPNIIYLLSFDRDIVEAAISEQGIYTGRQYLEKVVQVGFNLPLADSNKILETLTTGVNKSLSSGGDFNFDEQYFWNLYQAGLRAFFVNLRDVHRFLSTLDFSVARFKSNSKFEVNFVDLFTIEAIRVFEPAIYSEIKNSKNLLTGNSAIDAASAKEQIESLISKGSPRNQSLILNLIKRLFPAIEQYFGGTSYGNGFHKEWYKNRRICSTHLFDTYFFQGIPEKEISLEEIYTVISKANCKSELISLLRNYHERGRLAEILSKFDYFSDELPMQNIRQFLYTLADLGDDIPFDSEIGSFFTLQRQIYGLISALAFRIADVKEREEVITSAIFVSNSLFIPIMTVNNIISSENDDNENLASKLVISWYIPVLISRIRSYSDNFDKFITHPKLSYIISFWIKHGNIEDVKAWAFNCIIDHKSALMFLSRHIRKSRVSSSGDYVPRIMNDILLSDIERVLPAEKFSDLLQGVDPEELDGEEKEALVAFNAAMKRREEGRPDVEW